ncbi:major tail tube protein [Halolamina pelagica]|uniref:Major tail tube protein n=1 Tax=Halolamina pelagica TaxID=699431 RepID=A0A0P7HQ39_9EURY|nr:phage major tail tube protein [Halolamina pelagica]KPN28886.1 major tail tube protein [Halolamina pelagica]
MEMTWTPGGLLVDGLSTPSASPIHDCLVAFHHRSYESDETGEVLPVEIVVRGRHKSIAWAKPRKAKTPTGEISTTLSYYKLVIGGEEIIEIDKPGYVFRVRGVDRMAERRQALGV